MFKKLNFTKKLFFSFSLIIFFIIFFGANIFLKYNSSTLKENIETSSMDSLLSIQHQIDDDLVGLDQMLKAIHASPDFTALAFSLPDEYGNFFMQHPFEASAAQSILSSYLTTSNPDASMIYVSEYYDFLKVSNTYSRDRLLFKDDIANLPYVKEGMNTKLYQIYCPPHDNPWAESPEQVYSVIRPIRDTFHTYGIMEYQKSTSHLDDLIDNVSLSNIVQFTISGPEGDLWYKYDTGRSCYADNHALAEQTGNSEKGLVYLNKDTLLCYIRSPLTGWTLAMERDVTPLLESERHFTLMITILCLLALLALLLLLYVVLHTLTKPLHALKSSLSRLEMNKDIHIPKTGNDEITILATGIEETLNKLRSQNTQLINTRKRAIQAHFEAMEAQLNPHFLYNTLSVIGACGMEAGNMTISKMCAELSSLLRYSITYTYKDVRLRNELENIRNYLYIMKIRYEHMVDYTWDVDESVLDIPVPKLILQPIIENCFQHGFKNIAPPWHIKIKIGKNENNWYAAITNNGRPIELEKIKELNSQLQYFKDHMDETSDCDFDKEKMGFGLENTVLRLYIYYKGNESFSIYKTDTDETTVEIGGPIDEYKNPADPC